MNEAHITKPATLGEKYMAGSCKHLWMLLVLQHVSKAIIAAFAFSFIVFAATALGDQDPWSDKFYQYHIPVDVVVESPGWNQIPLDEKQITGAINAIEEFQYDAQFFAYNYLKVIQPAPGGSASEIEAGFYMIPDGETDVVPLTNGPVPREGLPISLPVEPHCSYLVRYTAMGGSSSPLLNYEPVFPVGHPMRWHAARISYEPRLLRLAKTEYETLLIPYSNIVRHGFMPGILRI